MPSAQDRIRALWESRSEFAEPEVTPSYTFDSSRNLRITLVKVAAFFLAVALGFVWLNRPKTIAVPQVIASGSPIGSSNASQTNRILVDVEGKVRHPGLHRLPSDARVADAIAAAGGLLASAERGSLNLAARITDGQLITVGQKVTQTAPLGEGSQSTSGQISINTATQAMLESLPGVGPVMASRIISYRTTNGSFSSLKQLQEVPGIGPKVFANLVNYLTL